MGNCAAPEICAGFWKTRSTGKRAYLSKARWSFFVFLWFSFSQHGLLNFMERVNPSLCFLLSGEEHGYGVAPWPAQACVFVPFSFPFSHRALGNKKWQGRQSTRTLAKTNTVWLAPRMRALGMARFVGRRRFSKISGRGSETGLTLNTIYLRSTNCTSCLRCGRKEANEAPSQLRSLRLRAQLKLLLGVRGHRVWRLLPPLEAVLSSTGPEQ